MLKLARSIYSTRLIALLTLVTMVTPLFLVGKVSTASAASISTGPLSAPPEPFLFEHGERSPVFLTSYVTAIGEFFSPPKLPDGFEMAKVPTLTEKITSYFGSFLGLVTGPAAPAPPAAPQPWGTTHRCIVNFDFDGDGATDIGRWHPTTTEMKIKLSGGGFDTYSMGTGARMAPGDYDGDDETDAGVYLSGTWTYKLSASSSSSTYSWGTSTDIPVPAEYDGKGKTNFAYFRPSNSTWYIKTSSGGTITTTLGTTGDIPVPGDYDGDGTADIAVFRPSTGDWHINGSSSGYYSSHWGASVDTPVPADFDGDNVTDMAVYRSTTGEWFAYKSSTSNGEYLSATWGSYGDQPVPGDYDGDNMADFAIWRPTTGGWYVIKSSGGYDYQILGIPGDRAVPSSFIKQVGSTVSGSDVNNARHSPKNTTGGTDFYSRNFSWSTGLVGLPGRSGLDMGFGLSYNSLVWLRQGNSVLFDPDTSNITPGFRFGFPVIEPVYYDDNKDNFAYMMVTPSGGRVEFRQTAASNTYETADSSYTQLVTTGASHPNAPVEDITIMVRTTDGMQMSYEWKAGAFRCKEIKDRNGNYITITHNDYGGLTTVTDTLGRVVTVNYASGEAPTSITQTWKDTNGSGSNVTHTWVTFTYTNIQIDTNFMDGSTALNVFGPQDGTNAQVLQKITRTDGSYTTFDYNTWGQVKQINNYAPDAHKLNHIAVNLPANASTAVSDCPRFTETRSYIENFNSGNDVVLNNSIPTAATYSVPSETGSAARIQTWFSGHPDNLRSITYVGSSGWKEGLPIATEDCLTTSDTSCTTRKRWTWTKWDQDDTGFGYKLNPRVIESQVGDGSNVKKSTTEYYVFPSTTVAIWGLVKESIVYKSDLTNIEKKVFHEYDLNTEYTNRRIIGVPYSVHVYGYGQENSSLNLVSKTTYGFDQGNFSDSGLGQNISPVQHDNTNYSSSFITGRANLTSATRWDINYPNTSSYAVTSSVKYNTAGSVVSKTNPMGRVVKISYADAFNSTVSGSTYAYATTITDPNDYSSTIKYRYDMGVSVEALSPPAAGNSYGKKSRSFYDSAGRLEKNSIGTDTEGGGYLEHSYTRYGRPTTDNGIQTFQYTPIIDADSDGNLTEDEVTIETLFDGMGRVRMSRTENPGSTGGYSGQKTEYDVLGQVKRQSLPTEMDSGWNAAGDDYTRGFLWTHQKYDWKGRVVRKISTDGIDQTTLNDSDVIISYDGCGCAGGQVTTIQGELVLEPGTTNYERRTRKIYEDILGRDFKTEIYKYNDEVGTTILNTYNGRDQVVTSRQYHGNTTGTIFQDTTMAYDGHGRLMTQHLPQQRTSGGTATYTTYAYNNDDSLESVMDGRGATVNYGYNNQALPVSITYTVPFGSGITSPSSIAFDYDAIGNRTSMEDGLGSVTYEYNELSQMTAETRQFSETIGGAPTGGYRLDYTYTLGGQLKSYTDGLGVLVSYAHDKTGRLMTVSGSGSTSGTTTFASNADYRAWGALTHVDYGNGTEMNVGGFNNKNQATTFEVKKNTTQIINKEYQYYSDGMMKKEDDNLDARFDRSYQYDNMERLVETRSGIEANGGTGSASNIPFRNSFSYDVFGNRTGNDFRHYTRTGSLDLDYVNNRLDPAPSHLYDAEGNQLVDTEFSAKSFVFDASGNLSKSVNETIQPVEGDPPTLEFVWQTAEYSYDGDGLLVREKTYDLHEIGNTETDLLRNWKIRSTPLGGEVVTEIGYSLAGVPTYIRANGTVIATVTPGTGANPVYRHKDPAMNTHINTDGSGFAPTHTELDPDGKDVGLTDPYYIVGIPDPSPNMSVPGQNFSSLVNGNFTTYTVDGIPVTFGHFGRMIDQAYGGLFGLIEMQANISRGQLMGRLYTYTDANRNYGFMDRARAYQLQREGHGQIDRFDFWGVSTNNWSVSIWLLPQDIKKPELLAPLGAEKSTAINNALKELARRIKEKKWSKECQDNVINKLETIDGFSMDKLLTFLGEGADFYDGENSHAPMNDYDEAHVNADPSSNTVAQEFANHSGWAAFTANGAKVNRLTVFFVPSTIEVKAKKSMFSADKQIGLTNDNLAFLFHEALHAYGFSVGKFKEGFSDKALMKLFFPDGDPPGGSQNISNEIKKYCFK